MRKLQLLFIAILIHACVSAQVNDGDLMFDFTLNDVQGNSHSLYTTLDAGKTVVLFCFATWDSYAWEYYQQQTLENFNSIYGASGTNVCDVWRFECESGNTTAQLEGPQSIGGNISTDTYGNWIESSGIPVIDSSLIATQLGLTHLPTIVIICPDRVVRYADALPLYQLEEIVFENSCQALIAGYDPAIFSPVVDRSCGTNTVDLHVALKNLGTDTLTSATIQVSGSAEVSTFTWTGELLSYAADTITISGINLINDDPIAIAITNVNARAENDSLEARCAVGYSQLLVKLELALDAYPDEVSWEIRDDVDSVLYNGGGYTIPYQFISGVFAMPAAGCYSFYLNDSNGDGLHGSPFGGFDGFCRLLSMQDSLNVDATLFDYDGSYNFTEVPNTAAFVQVTYEAGSALNVNSTEHSAFIVYPNPTHDLVNIQWSAAIGYKRVIVHDAFGRLVHADILQQGMHQSALNTRDWKDGMYRITLISENEHHMQRVLVQHE